MLLISMVLATYFFHDFCNFEGEEQQQQMIQCMMNLALLGSMHFLIAHGAGAMCLGTRHGAGVCR